jgi:hypothetical protein
VVLAVIDKSLPVPSRLRISTNKVDQRFQLRLLATVAAAQSWLARVTAYRGGIRAEVLNVDAIATPQLFVHPV